MFESASELPKDGLIVDIWTSDERDAKGWMTGAVKTISSVTVRVDTPFDLLPKFVNSNNETYRMVKWEIELTCSGTLLRFAAIVNGVRQDPKNVKAEFFGSQGREDPVMDFTPSMSRLNIGELA